MGWGEIAGMPGITPRIGAAALALVTAATEPKHYIAGFSHQLVPLDISPRMRLDRVAAYLDSIPMGGTDCAAPMLDARKQKMPVDLFVVITDNETWAGHTHPAEALRDYRKAMGINAKLVVLGMTATDCSIADPNDAGMLDVAGFDSSFPTLLTAFAKL